MDHLPYNLIEKFVSGNRLTNEEFTLLDKLLNNPHDQQEIYNWLKINWQQGQSANVELQFEQIRDKIRSSSVKLRMNQLFLVLGKAAAILVIPFLAAVLYFIYNHTASDELFTLATQKGEQTSLILPDGSKVWLNVDTKLSYPVDYGINSRKLKLEGEAYFEVEKNKKLPFIVTSGQLVTKAIGTRFNISAYPESSEIKSSLVEGSVLIEYGEIQKTLKPGQQFISSNKGDGISINTFDEYDELAWKNEQLIFRLTPFDQVIRELEKWYDVNIEYNPALFKSETLTVRFEKSEALEKVLLVIAKTNGFKYTIKDKEVRIFK